MLCGENDVIEEHGDLGEADVHHEGPKGPILLHEGPVLVHKAQVCLGDVRLALGRQRDAPRGLVYRSRQ